MLNARKQTRVKSHDYLLKGLVYCHECGKKVGCSPRKLSKGTVYYFRCSTYTSYSKLEYCTPHSIRMDKVEKLVVNKLKNIIYSFRDREEIKRITKQKIDKNSKKDEAEVKLKECNKKLERVSLEIDSIYMDKLNGILSEDDFKRIYERKKEEKSKIQEKINELEKNRKKKMSKVEEDILANKLIEEFYKDLVIDREILINLVDRIEIDKDKKVYIFFKFKLFDKE